MSNKNEYVMKINRITAYDQEIELTNGEYNETDIELLVYGTDFSQKDSNRKLQSKLILDKNDALALVDMIQKFYK